MGAGRCGYGSNVDSRYSLNVLGWNQAPVRLDAEYEGGDAFKDARPARS